MPASKNMAMIATHPKSINIDHKIQATGLVGRLCATSATTEFSGEGLELAVTSGLRETQKSWSLPVLNRVGARCWDCPNGRWPAII